MSQSVRLWIGVLVLAVGPGIWTILHNFHGVQRAVLGALAGVCMATAISLIIKKTRKP